MFFRKEEKNVRKKVLVCSMVFGGGPLNTLKLFLDQMFYYFFNKVHEKCILYHFKICLKKNGFVNKGYLIQ